jgi:hypothetical protein
MVLCTWPGGNAGVVVPRNLALVVETARKLNHFASSEFKN